MSNAFVEQHNNDAIVLLIIQHICPQNSKYFFEKPICQLTYQKKAQDNLNTDEIHRIGLNI